MGRYSENQFFQGEIDGKKINDFFILDVNKEKTEDRINEINEILEESNYFTDFFSDRFKVNLNQNDALSEDVNVCQTLERMANYILNSKEEVELRSKEKPEYVFHTNKDKFNAKISREMVNIVTNDGQVKNLVDSENIVHTEEVKKTNTRASKTQTITTKDLIMDNECGRVLRDYQVFLSHVDKKLKGKPDKNWRKYSNAKGQVKDDMINAKNMLLGVWGLNGNISESHIPDMDIFDFTDFDTVRLMINMQKPNFLENKDMWIVWLDFNNTVKKANFTEEENAVYELLQYGYTMVDIAEKLDIDYYRVRRTVVGNIIKKIAAVGNKYDAEDNYTKYKILNRKTLAQDKNIYEEEAE